MTISEPVFLDRSSRGKFRFTGEQAAWFLHQVLTQAFEDIAPGQAREAAMLTVHGRMVAYVEVVATEDALWAHFEDDLRATFPDALSQMVFATQVEIEDLSDDFGLFLVAGDGWEQAVAKLPSEYLVQPTKGLGESAAYLWIARDMTHALADELKSLGFRAATEAELEAVRVANGAPRWGFDMDAKTFPQEAGIDDHAVHYDKGCYLGQEAMAKIHFRGKVNRRLARVEAPEELRSGATLTKGGKSSGTITSASGRLALAMIRYDIAPGESLLADDVEVKVLD